MTFCIGRNTQILNLIKLGGITHSGSAVVKGITGSFIYLVYISLCLYA